MNKREGEKATPLEGEEAAQWRQVGASIGGLARLMVEGAPVEVLQATMEDVRAVGLDQKRVLNALMVPEDAGVYAEGLEKILRRIPDGWGRWISCGKGWYPILVGLDEQLALIDDDYVVHQVKEKYARLCYYCENSRYLGYLRQELMDKAVSAAEAKAAKTCEDCGKEGVLMTSNGSEHGWMKTLCLEDGKKNKYAAPPPWQRELMEDEKLGEKIKQLEGLQVRDFMVSLTEVLLPIYEANGGGRRLRILVDKVKDYDVEEEVVIIEEETDTYSALWPQEALSVLAQAELLIAQEHDDDHFEEYSASGEERRQARLMAGDALVKAIEGMVMGEAQGARTLIWRSEQAVREAGMGEWSGQVVSEAEKVEGSVVAQAFERERSEARWKAGTARVEEFRTEMNSLLQEMGIKETSSLEIE